MPPYYQLTICEPIRSRAENTETDLDEVQALLLKNIFKSKAKGLRVIVKNSNPLEVNVSYAYARRYDSPRLALLHALVDKSIKGLQEVYSSEVDVKYHLKSHPVEPPFYL